MTRSIASKIVFPIPQLFVIDGYGNLIATNNQPLTEEGYLQEDNGAVDLITVDLVKAVRVNLKTQLENFFEPTTQFLDRTVSDKDTSIMAVYTGGYNRSSELSGDNAIDGDCFYKPRETLPIDPRTTTLTNSLKWVYLEEAVWKSINGRLYESNKWLHFDQKKSPLVQIVSTFNTTSLFYSTNKMVLLDDLVQGQDSVMVQGMNFYFDTSWEEVDGATPSAHNWKRLRHSDTSPAQTINFLSAKVINKEKFIFMLSGLSGYTGLSAGQYVYLSTGTINTVAPDKNYAIMQGYAISPTSLESENNEQIDSVYTFAKMANGRIHSPTTVFPSVANGVYGDFLLSTNDALAELSTVTDLVSPAKALFDKYGEMLGEDPISVEKFWNKNTDPQVAQDRFGIVDSTDISDILNEDYVNYAWKGHLLDVDFLGMLAYIYGYKDSQYYSTMGLNEYGMSNHIPWALNTKIFHGDIQYVTLTVERSTGRLFWHAAGAAVADGKLNKENLIISWIPRDRDGNQWPVLTTSTILHHRDEDKYAGLRFGMAYGPEDYVESSNGSKNAYNGDVTWKEGDEVWNQAGKVGSTVDEIDQSFGAYYNFGLYEYANEYVGPSNKNLFSNVLDDTRYKGQFPCNGVLSVAPKGITYQALLGTYYGQGGFGVSLDTAIFCNAPTEENPNPNPGTSEFQVGNVRPFNELGAPLIGFYFSAYFHIYNYIVPDECDGDCTYRDGGCQATLTIGGKSFNMSSIAGSTVGGSLYTLGYFADTISNSGETIDGTLSISTPHDGQNACYVYVRGVALYADNTAYYPTAGITTEQQITGGADAEEATENARVAFNWHDRHSFPSSLPMEANTTYVIQSEIHSIDDAHYGLRAERVPTQIVFPEKFDSEVLWLGPNVSNFNDLFTRLAALSDGWYGTVRDPQWTNYQAGDCPFLVPIRPGNTKKFYHIGGKVTKVVSLRETYGGKALFEVSITGGGDYVSVKAPADQKGYDWLILYDDYNEMPGFIGIQVCSYNFAVFPDLHDDVTEIKYFMNLNRKQALSAHCSPLSITKRIAIGSYNPITTGVKVIAPSGEEHTFGTRCLLDAASGASQGRFNNPDSEEGTFSVDMDYALDPDRTKFDLTGVKLTLSKTKLTITDSQGDSLTVTNAQGVKFRPRLCEYLVDPSDTSKTTQIACDVPFTDDLWTTTDQKTWTLTFSAGYNPPASNGFNYSFCIMGLLDGEFIPAFTEPFRIDVETTTSGSGGAYDPSNPPSNNTNTFPQSTTTSQSGWPQPASVAGQDNRFYYNTTPFNVGQFGFKINWPDPVIT